MNNFLSLWQHTEIVYRVGWILVHSIWQITLIAALAALTTSLLRNAAARTRYNVLVAFLLLISAIPVLTWHVCAPRESQAKLPLPYPVHDGVGLHAPSDSSHAAPRPFHASSTTQAESISSAADRSLLRAHPADQPPAQSANRLSNFARNYVDPLVSWLVAAWVIGASLFAGRPIFGWLIVRRLRGSKISAVSQRVQDSFDKVAGRMRIKGVSIAKSVQVTSPIVVGWLKPVVLLPSSVITGLSTEQLESIIAHELAHVLRNDYVFNFFQTLVESAYFYHPCVWWISNQIRKEREYCADEIAVGVVGSKGAYGRALLSIAELKGTTGVLALGAGDGNLFDRVSRLFGKKKDRSALAGLLTILSVVLVVALAYLAISEFTESLAANRNAPTSGVTQVAQMSESEAAAWDALAAMSPQDFSETFGRQARLHHVSTLQSAGFPRDVIESKIAEANQPIKSLSLHNPPAEAWAQIEKLVSIESLSLVAATVTPEVADSISKMKGLKRIHVVNCRGVLPGFLDHLSELVKLEEIDVLFNVFDQPNDTLATLLGDLNEAEEQLLNSPVAPSNRNIRIAAVLTDRALPSLAGLKGLRRLHLGNTFCSAGGFTALKGLTQLVEIDISVLGSSNTYYDSLEGFNGLKVSQLGDFDDEMLAKLELGPVEKIEGWAGPTSGGSGVTWVGLKSAAKMKNLKRLSLRGASITTADLYALLQTRQANKLSKMEFLDLTHCKLLDAPGLDEIRTQWNGLEIKLSDTKMLDALPWEKTKVTGQVMLEPGQSLPAGTLLRYQTDRQVGLHNTHGSSANFECSEDGSFEIDIPVGRAWIFLSVPGYADTWAGPLLLKPDVPLQDVNLQLELGETTTIVVQDENGRRVPKATVTIWPEIAPDTRPSSSSQKSTNERGEYLLHFLPEKRYEINARSPGLNLNDKPKLERIRGAQTIVRLSKAG